MQLRNCLRNPYGFYITFALAMLGLLITTYYGSRFRLPSVAAVPYKKLFAKVNQTGALFQLQLPTIFGSPIESERYKTEVNFSKIPYTNLTNIEKLEGREFWASFQPSYRCPQDLLIKVGGKNDGGKWVCGIETLGRRTVRDGYNCTVYSFGVSSDSRFEAGVLTNTQCNVFAYDPTVNSIASPLRPSNPRVQFEKIGISEVNTFDRRTLKTLMKQNGHEFIDILKMDVEGAEISSLDKMMADFEELPFGQLQVEFHGREVVGMIRKLEEKGARLFYNEPNQFFPELCGELAFFNLKYRRLFIDD